MVNNCEFMELNVHLALESEALFLSSFATFTDILWRASWRSFLPSRWILKQWFCIFQAFVQLILLFSNYDPYLNFRTLLEYSLGHCMQGNTWKGKRDMCFWKITLWNTYCTYSKGHKLMYYRWSPLFTIYFLCASLSLSYLMIGC